MYPPPPLSFDGYSNYMSASSYIFVILILLLEESFNMILDYSTQSEEEQRLMVELNSLDECLYFKSFGNNNNMQHEDSLQRYGSFAKYHQNKQNNMQFHNQITHAQYFSEIDNKDEEYDTLFDQPNHFLAYNSPLQPHTPHPPTQKDQIQPQEQQKLQNIPQANFMNHSNNQQKHLKHQQILKEQEFVLKKQKKDAQNTLSKKHFPPNHKNIFTKTSTQTRKKSILNEKNHNIPANTHTNEIIPPQLSNQTDISCSLQQKQQKKITNKDNLHFKGNCKTEISQQKYQTIQEYLQHIASNASRQKTSNSQKYRLEDRNNFVYSDKSSLECTFHPKILKKSQDMVKNNKGFVQRLSTNYDKKNEKMPYQPVNTNNKKLCFQRMQKLSQPRPQKMPKPQEIEDLPSFRPSLSKKSIQHMSNCTYDVATRNKLWLQQKEEKIAKLRKEQEDQKRRKEELSHHPILKPYKGEQDVYFSKFGKEGMVQYFQRLSILKNKNLSCSNLSKENFTKKEANSSFNNKENTSSNINKEKSKKQTYEQAVKGLHHKIMKLKI